MAIKPDLRRYFVLLILSIFNSRYIYGYPGRIESDGSATFDVPGKPGFSYVTIWRGQKLVIDQAINIGASPNPNLLVQMERVRGVLTVIRADPLSAAQAFGELVGTAGVPRHSHAIGSGLDDPVEGRRFLPGLVSPSESGGLNVRVDGFASPYGLIADTDPFAIDDPPSAGTQGWVVVWQGSNNSLGYTLPSTTYPVGAVMSETSIPTDVVLPADALPLGAVIVANGGAVTQNSRFYDYRFHLVVRTKHNLVATTAPTLNDDAGDGYSVGSTWFNTTTLILYTCHRSTVGNALWMPYSPQVALYLAENYF